MAMRGKSTSRGGRDGKDSRKKTDRDKEAGARKRVRVVDGIEDVDFRDTGLLRKFLTEHGKLLPARITGVTAAQQRRIARAIRRARVMGIVP
jgi:small subunit ribosomal protein S18